MRSTGPFQYRWLKGHIFSSCYYHLQIGSIHLPHCFHIFPWLCAWDVCYIIFCHLLHTRSGKTGNLFSLLLCSLWWVLNGGVLVCRHDKWGTAMVYSIDSNLYSMCQEISPDFVRHFEWRHELNRGHDDLIWKHFPRYWPFVRVIDRPPVDSPHKSQWHGALMLSLICSWNKRLSKQSIYRWFEMPLWRHYNVIWNHRWSEKTLKNTCLAFSQQCIQMAHHR